MFEEKKEKERTSFLPHTHSLIGRPHLEGAVNGTRLAHTFVSTTAAVEVPSMSLIDVLAVQLLTSEWHIYHCCLRKMVLLCHFARGSHTAQHEQVICLPLMSSINYGGICCTVRFE